MILTQSYWRDEAFTVMQAGESLKELFHLIKWDSSPPLYYLILHGWIKVFGEGEAVTRSLSLIFHLLTVMVVGLILKELTKNKIVGFLGAIAVLLNPFLVGYAFEARPYALLVLCLALAVWLDLKKRSILTGIMLGLMVLTHNYGLFFLASWGLYWFYRKKPIKVLAISLMAWLVWLPIFWMQFKRVVNETWIQPMGWLFLTVSLQIFFLGYGQIKILDLACQLAIILLVVALAGQLNKKTSLIFWLWLGPMLMAALFSKLVTPIYNERYLIAGIPMLIIWISEGLNQRKKLWAGLLVVAYLIINGWGVWQLLNKETKPRIREAVAQVMTKIKPGEVIIADSELNFLEVKYYSQKINKEIPVWVHYEKNKNELPYYLGSPFYKEVVFTKEIPVNQPAWVIRTDGSFSEAGI